MVKTIKSLDDLTGSGDTNISRIAQSMYARLDKANADMEFRAAGAFSERIRYIEYIDRTANSSERSMRLKVGE